MIQVIKKNPIQYDVICDFCKSELRFDNFEIITKIDEYLGELHTYSSINCPVCNKEIILMTDMENVSGYKRYNGGK